MSNGSDFIKFEIKCYFPKMVRDLSGTLYLFYFDVNNICVILQIFRHVTLLLY